KIKSLRTTEHNEEISLINHKINNINFKINKTKKAIKYGKIEKLKGCTIINKLEERKDNQFSIIKELQKNIFKKNQELISNLEDEKKELVSQIDFLEKSIYIKQQDLSYE
ncbi:hypothetical protein, partial [Neisseria cinerea]